MAKESRITKITLELQEGGNWLVTVHKEFSESAGGGSQDFKMNGGEDLRSAWTLWRGFTTSIPSFRICETCGSPVTRYGCLEECKKPSASGEGPEQEQDQPSQSPSP